MTLELIITLLLFFLLILSGGAMLYIAKTSPTDGQTFQVFAGAMHDLLGAFLTLIVPRIFGMLKPVPSNGTPAPAASPSLSTTLDISRPAGSGIPHDPNVPFIPPFAQKPEPAEPKP